MTRPPPPELLERFGAGGVPTPLDGGQGGTWRVGDVVVKPVPGVTEHAWVCEVYDAWPADADVRVPEPLRADDGAWSHAGWVYRLATRGWNQAHGVVPAGSDGYPRRRGAWVDLVLARVNGGHGDG